MHIIIHNKEFESKKAAIEHISKVLRHNGNKDYKPPSDAFNFLKSVLDMHPDREEKLAHGLSYFKVVMKNAAKTNYTVYIVNHRGEMLDFSWRRCLGLNVNTLTVAMRLAIEPQVSDFRAANMNINICEVCKNLMEEKHVDHVIKFRHIRDEFLKTTTLKKPISFDACKSTHAAKFKGRDFAFELAWSEYHKQHAVLRVICKKCNLTLR